MGRAFNFEVFARRLKELMQENNDTVYTLAEYLHLSPSSISKYSNALMVPKTITIDTIANKYNVNPVWLMGAEVNKYYESDNKRNYKRVPLLGEIACGLPMFAEENIEGYEYIEQYEDVTFCLRAKGDSMIGARICDGDIVYVREQSDVDNGDIAAVLIDDETTLKRVYKINGKLILRPENPAYKDIVLSKKEMRENNVRILGKVKAFKSEL